MAHIPKNYFDTELLQRATLSEEKELVFAAQAWFDRLVKEYLHTIGKKGGLITVHRAILICILNNSQTVTLEFALEKEVKIGHKIFKAERFYIKCNGRAYVICIHNEESFIGGVIDFNEIGRYTAYIIGTEELQNEGRSIVDKIKKTGLLEILSGKKKVNDNRGKILRILENLDPKAVEDIEETISNLKKQRGELLW